MTKDILDAKQIAFIDAYFKYQDVSTICNELNISRASYYNYINNEEIKKEINRQLAEILKDTTRYLKSKLNRCSIELMNIIESDKTPPQVKINAINSVFTNTLKLTEQVDIINKLESIEQRLSDAEYNQNGGILWLQEI